MWILKYEQGHVCYREHYLLTLRSHISFRTWWHKKKRENKIRDNRKNWGVWKGRWRRMWARSFFDIWVISNFIGQLQYVYKWGTFPIVKGTKLFLHSANRFRIQQSSKATRTLWSICGCLI
jgi:hypothetical protein